MSKPSYMEILLLKVACLLSPTTQKGTEPSTPSTMSIFPQDNFLTSALKNSKNKLGQDEDQDEKQEQKEEKKQDKKQQQEKAEQIDVLNYSLNLKINTSIYENTSWGTEINEEKEYKENIHEFSTAEFMQQIYDAQLKASGDNPSQLCKNLIRLICIDIERMEFILNGIPCKTAEQYLNFIQNLDPIHAATTLIGVNIDTIVNNASANVFTHAFTDAFTDAPTDAPADSPADAPVNDTIDYDNSHKSHSKQVPTESTNKHIPIYPTPIRLTEVSAESKLESREVKKKAEAPEFTEPVILTTPRLLPVPVSSLVWPASVFKDKKPECVSLNECKNSGTATLSKRQQCFCHFCLSKRLKQINFLDKPLLAQHLSLPMPISPLPALPIASLEDQDILNNKCKLKLVKKMEKFLIIKDKDKDNNNNNTNTNTNTDRADLLVLKEVDCSSSKTENIRAPWIMRQQLSFLVALISSQNSFAYALEQIKERVVIGADEILRQCGRATIDVEHMYDAYILFNFRVDFTITSIDNVSRLLVITSTQIKLDYTRYTQVTMSSFKWKLSKKHHNCPGSACNRKHKRRI